MKNNIVIVMICVMLIFILTSCTTSKTSESLKILVYMPKDPVKNALSFGDAYEQFYGHKMPLNYYQDNIDYDNELLYLLINEFEMKSNVKVEFINLGDLSYKDYLLKRNALIMSEDSPDLIYDYDFMFYDLIKNERISSFEADGQKRLINDFNSNEFHPLFISKASIVTDLNINAMDYKSYRSLLSSNPFNKNIYHLNLLFDLAFANSSFSVNKNNICEFNKDEVLKNAKEIYDIVHNSNNKFDFESLKNPQITDAFKDSSSIYFMSLDAYNVFNGRNKLLSDNNTKNHWLPKSKNEFFVIKGFGILNRSKNIKNAESFVEGMYNQQVLRQLLKLGNDKNILMGVADKSLSLETTSTDSAISGKIIGLLEEFFQNQESGLYNYLDINQKPSQNFYEKLKFKLIEYIINESNFNPEDVERIIEDIKTESEFYE